MQPIENFEALTLKFALKDMISEEAAITTDHVVSKFEKRNEY